MNTETKSLVELCARDILDQNLVQIKGFTTVSMSKEVYDDRLLRESVIQEKAPDEAYGYQIWFKYPRDIIPKPTIIGGEEIEISVPTRVELDIKYYKR